MTQPTKQGTAWFFARNRSRQTSPSDWPTFVPAALAVAVVVMLVYWPVTKAGFVWDDLLTFQQRLLSGEIVAGAPHPYRD